MFPTSTTTLSRRSWPSSTDDVPMGSTGGPVASSVSAEDTSFVHRTAAMMDLHWCRSSDIEPRRRPPELAEHLRLHG